MLEKSENRAIFYDKFLFMDKNKLLKKVIKYKEKY